jgi:hypothetical protein
MVMGTINFGLIKAATPPCCDIAVAVGFPVACYSKGGFVGGERWVLSGAVWDVAASVFLAGIAILIRRFSIGRLRKLSSI